MPSRTVDRDDLCTPMTRGLLALTFLFVGTATAQPGALFPQPFVVEHHMVQTDVDGSSFTSEAVTDYYSGSWLVSVRPDGSRLILDFARREATEVRPAEGTYWTASFERMGELAGRIAASQWRGGGERPEPAAGRRAALAEERGPDLVVEELSSGEALELRGRGGMSAKAGAPDPPVLHLRVVERQRSADPRAGVEVWLDPSLRLPPVALSALASFERTVSAAPGSGGDARRGGEVAQHLAAARVHAGGALPVRTVRALGGRSGAAGRLEDVATRVERLDALPRDLVVVPEGLRRVPHPMEAVAAFLEAEAERDRAMSGGRGQ